MAAGQRCWACGTANTPPQNDGIPAALFKCGWCGALNSRSDSADTTSDHAAPRLLLAHPRRGHRAVIPYAAGCVLIVLVLIVIGSIFVLGLSLVLPVVASPSQILMLHGPAASLICFGIFYNYAACTVRAPGPVQAQLQRTAITTGGHVRRGALDGCRYCEHCCYYKPQGTHHCRSCGVCVAGLDHHCWYLNNCCGQANLRSFILLLGYVVVGVSYALAAGLAMGWADRRVIVAHTWRVVAGTGRFHPVLRVLCFSLYWVLSAPTWLALWAFFTGMSWAVLMGVGLLFRRQVQLLVQGHTYLDSLGPAQRADAAAQQKYWDQVAPTADASLPPAAAELELAAVAAAEAEVAAAAAAAGESTAMRNARRVFGGGHPLTWLLPAWDVAPAGGPSGGRAKAS